MKNKKGKAPKITFAEILSKTLAETSQNSAPPEKRVAIRFGQIRARENNQNN